MVDHVKEKIIKNKTPLIIGGVVGLFIGIYGTSHYYQSEYAKLSAFTNMFGLGDIVNKKPNNNDEIQDIVRNIKKLRESIEEKVCSFFQYLTILLLTLFRIRKR